MSIIIKIIEGQTITPQLEEQIRKNRTDRRRKDSMLKTVIDLKNAMDTAKRKCAELGIEEAEVVRSTNTKGKRRTAPNNRRPTADEPFPSTEGQRVSNEEQQEEGREEEEGDDDDVEFEKVDMVTNKSGYEDRPFTDDDQWERFPSDEMPGLQATHLAATGNGSASVPSNKQNETVTKENEKGKNDTDNSPDKGPKAPPVYKPFWQRYTCIPIF